MSTSSGTTRRTSLCLGLLASFASLARGELTWKSWNKRTEGKPVFVLFTGDDCTFCKDIESAWVPLIEEWEGKDHAVVDYVDCTGDGKKICEKMDLLGKIPNMRHGWGGKGALKPGGLTGYSGSRFEDQLMEWARTALVPGMKPGQEFGKVDPKRGPQTIQTPEALERLKSTASASFTPEEFAAFQAGDMEAALGKIKKKKEEEAKTDNKPKKKVKKAKKDKGEL